MRSKSKNLILSKTFLAVLYKLREVSKYFIS